MIINKGIITALLFLTIATLPVFADIDSFTDSVEESNEDAQKDNGHYAKKQTHSSSSSCSDCCSDGVVEILFTLWMLDNGAVTFEPYPYATDDKYMHFNSLTGNDTSSFFGDGWSDRSFRYTVATSAVYTKDIGFGNESCLEGYIFKCIGPLFENIIYTDLKEVTGNVKLGGQMALLQSNPLSILLYGQWTHWYGKVGEELPKSGFSGGFILRSYPVKPLVVEWKLGWQSFGEDYTNFMESDVRLGVMINRVELFASWKYMNISNDTTSLIYSENNGVTLGTRLYF